MYSWEIDNLIKIRNYLLEIADYDKICKTSPQIDFIQYKPYSDDFYIHTNDNYCFNFKVKKFVREEEKTNKN